MKIYIYDIEVLAHDWIVVILDIDSGKYIVFHNDNFNLREFFRDNSDATFGGFNNKHYDDWIVQSMLGGADPETIKEHNDFIITGGNNGWEFPYIAFQRKLFNSFDLRDDIPDKGLSLKAIEGNLHLPIVESSIPFDYPDPLNEEQLAEVIKYCQYDVDSTYQLYLKRSEYIQSKIIVAELKGLNPIEALKLTNAKLSAIYLDAKAVERSDERDYIFPSNLHYDVIPEEILNFFRKTYDKSIPNEVLYKTKLKYTLGGCPCVYAWGGVHGAIPKYIDESTEDYPIRNKDVASLYPNSMLNFGYVSRNIKNPDAFRELVETRIKAKRAGEKDKATALKLVINTTYGAQLNQYNDLEDRWAGRSICITNQLAMTDLVCTLLRDCKTFKIINFNTDGVMYKIYKGELDRLEEIVKEWETRTGLELEEDRVARIIQKDVNNYIEVQEDGKIKPKGSYAKYMDPKDFSDNQFKTNSLKILHRALVEYFVNGILPEETIDKCQDIFEFQMIAKTGSTYSGSYHEIDGEKVDVQNVNRVYASKDPRYGTVKKIKKAGADKVAGLPDHCIIDNENKLTKADIDLQFYIDFAYKRIADYKGINTKLKRFDLEKFKEDLKMATTPKATETPTAPEGIKLNIYQKLIKAREMFLTSGAKKSGTNRYAKFKYFELEDIVPVKNKICSELGIVDVVSFNKETAILNIFNADNPEDRVIQFSMPVVDIESATDLLHGIQALGGVSTYLRRYLFMIFLDIVEADVIDGETNSEDSKDDSKSGKAGKPIGSATKSNRPASNEDRAKATEELTGVDAEATEAEIKAVKSGLKKLRGRYMDADKNITDQTAFDKYEPYIKETLAKTKANLTKKDAENLLIEIGEKIAE
ncbi:MAG: ERF family protein [Parabacteroides sp.]|nr:ERF family protein [Parabacteroides sp.]